LMKFDKPIWQPECTSSRWQGLIWGWASPRFINEPVTTIAFTLYRSLALSLASLLFVLFPLLISLFRPLSSLYSFLY
jgi:hypothetical protein